MIYFIFCIHNHQPAGNFEHVIERAYQRSYLPCLRIISKYPWFKVSIHTSGFLLDWLCMNHPEYIELLSSMKERGQVEIMGGGYYEPILSVIPPGDGYDQIKTFSARLKKVFGVDVKGAWLAERVWEPHLPYLLSKAGIRYVVVDDYHFIKAGLKREELGGYYVTEDMAGAIRVFPGSERLRYLIPFEPRERFIEHLRWLEQNLEKGNAVVYADDGEKFGIWPGTYRWVYQEGWLEGFIKGIEKERHWLRPVTFCEYMEREPPIGRIYLPTTSYMEMGEWSLPSSASFEYAGVVEGLEREGRDEIRRFVQGGIWRNFFAKYPEANWMHKRMLMVSRYVSEAMDDLKEYRLYASASRYLYMAQCNDAYWHGVFGGLYLPHLRAEIYRNLLRAENIVESMRSDRKRPLFKRVDMDGDLSDEVLIGTERMNLFFKPSEGGSLVEMDLKPLEINLLNTLARWQEGYHLKLKETESQPATEKAVSIHNIVRTAKVGELCFDTHRRVSLMEHFIRNDESFDAFYTSRYTELGDFFNGTYHTELTDSSLILSRKGTVDGLQVRLTKDIHPTGASTFVVSYRIENLSERDMDCRMGVEFNIILPGCNGRDCVLRAIPGGGDLPVDSHGEVEDVKGIVLVDRTVPVSFTVESSAPFLLWRFPVETVSFSESDLERIYQGSCFLFLFTVSLERGGVMERSLTVAIDREGG